MQFGAALGAARNWIERLRLELSLGGQPVLDLWLCPGSFEGYDFVPLDSAERLAEEAAAMENCVRTYARGIVSNRCRLWSIRKEGRRIADIEVRRDRGCPLVYLNEVSAARNEPAPNDIWWLATRWLHQHDLLSILPEPRKPGSVRPNAATWRRLWRPYWIAKRRFPKWLPIGPTWLHELW